MATTTTSRSESAVASSSASTARSSSDSLTPSSRGNFSGAARPPAPLPQRSMEATSRADDVRAAAGLPPNRSALSSLPPLKKKKTIVAKEKQLAEGAMAARCASFSSSSSDAGSQLCIGGGDDDFFYQLPVGGSSLDDDDSDLLSTSAYQYNSSSASTSNYYQRQQIAGQPTSSSAVNSPLKSRRRRPAKNSSKASSVRWVDSNQSFLSRDRFVKKYLSDSLLLSNSGSFTNGSSSRRRVSFSSSTSSASSSFRINRHEARHQPASSCYVPVAKTPARAAALEHDILLSSSCSSSSLLADAALVDMARAAKKQLESVAKRRQVLVGKWKQRRSYSQNSDSSVGASDCQVYEALSSDKDQYSVVAKVNLPCSLAEIQSVLSQSASRGTEFHRSMVMLFGDQYVYGLNVRTVDSSSSSAPLLRRSSASSLATRRSRALSSVSQHQAAPGTARLAVNAVSLLMKRRLVWRPQNMSFLDYSDERPLAKSVTRVLQTLDADSEDEEHEEQDENQYEARNSGGDPRQERRRARQSSALQLHESKRRARGLRGLLAGYVLQEDSEEQFTRLFFYANHKSVSAAAGAQSDAQHKHRKPVKVTSWSVQLIREMVNKLCTLESVVLRRRLGFYPLVDVPLTLSTAYSANNSSNISPSCGSSRNSSNSDVALLQTPTGCCASCYVPFNALLFRKRHFCHLCGLFTCRKCSKVEPIEKVLGLIDRRRVCVSCVSRVSHCAFSLDGQASESPQDHNQQDARGKAMAKLLFGGSSNDATGKKLTNVPEEDFPPLLGDVDDDDLASTVLEDLALFPDEQLENDLAADNVAAYLKKMFERGSSTMGRKNPFVGQYQQQGRFFGEMGGHAGENVEKADGASSPKDNICLLDSASQSSLEESVERELPRRAGAFA